MLIQHSAVIATPTPVAIVQSVEARPTPTVPAPTRVTTPVTVTTSACKVALTNPNGATFVFGEACSVAYADYPSANVIPYTDVVTTSTATI